MKHVMSTLIMLVLVSLLLIGNAQAYDLYEGATVIDGNDIDDIVPPSSSDLKSMAINCGASRRSGDPNGNPYLSGNGEHWGLNNDTDDLVVNGVTFYCDMWNANDEARNYNYENHDGVTDQDFSSWGTGDEWRFKVERGALHHGPEGGNDDGGIEWLSNHPTGRQSTNAVWQSPYESIHWHSEVISLSGADTTSVDNFKNILRRAGSQNTGGYEPGTDDCERDMGFEFAVEPNTPYNVKVIPYKNNGEDTNTRVEVDGFTILDNFEVQQDTDPDSEFLCVSYDLVTGLEQTILLVEVGRSGETYRGTNESSNIQDVSAIIVTDLTPEPPVTVLNGATAIITSNVDDIVTGDPEKTRAINCGEAWFDGAVDPNGWATGVWSSTERSQSITTVNGIDFYADIAHENSNDLKISCYNYLVENEGLTGGNDTEWYWIADTGDGDNPKVPNMTMGITGSDTNAANGVSNYEGWHNHAKLEMTGTDADAFEEILERAGRQNCGVRGERDMTYTFEDLLENHLYNVKVVPWKNNGEETHTFVSVAVGAGADVTILDDFQVGEDLDPNNILCVSYDVILGSAENSITVKVGTSDATPVPDFKGQDVSMIMIEDLGLDPSLDLVTVDAGVDDFTWFPGGGEQALYQLAGVVTPGANSGNIEISWTVASAPLDAHGVDFHSQELTAAPLAGFHPNNTDDSIDGINEVLTGMYTLRITVVDEFEPGYDAIVEDTVDIMVYADGCKAARAEDPDNAILAGDIYPEGGDCVVNLSDFAVMAADWLVDTAYYLDF